MGSHRFFPAIDGLRAAAVLLVLVGHTMPLAVGNGGVGVDIFFVISGFLVGGLLLEEAEKHRRVRLGRFYGRRAVRLLPALVVMLAVTAPFLHPSALQVTSILLYFANWLRAGGDTMTSYGHTWSLSVEEQFYLLWPLVVMGCLAASARTGRALRRFVAMAALAGVVIAMASRVLSWSDVDVSYNSTFTRMDGMLAGVVLAVSWPWVQRAAIRERLLRWSVVPAAVFLAFDYMHVGRSLAISLVTPLACACLVGAAAVGLPRFLDIVFTHRVVLWLGKISYGLYLWHYPLIDMLPPMAPKRRTLVVAAVTLACATASWYVVERPVSRRLRPSFK